MFLPIGTPEWIPKVLTVPRYYVCMVKGDLVPTTSPARLGSQGAGRLNMYSD